MVPANPEKIGRYKIIDRVGKGGMGVLYRGVDPVLDREVAIKLMLIDFSEDVDQMRPRFYREARAAAKLQHPNIVTVFEFAEDGNTPYIVMEFLRGTSLQARMASPVPLTLEEKLNVMAQLCNALNYAHEQGVVHRDIKPANIFILPDSSVKLLDFGVAKLATSTMTRQGDVLGSASYMSPEQVSGSDSVDGRSDIFSAGVVLYELLASRKPFQADTLTATVVKLLRDEPPSLDEIVPGLPPQLVAAVKRALAKDPAARFATAGELAKELHWIRQALEASNQGAALEETKFASPTQIRQIQQNLEQDRVSASPTIAPGASESATTSGARKWLIPAGIGAAVVAIGLVVYPMTRRDTPAAPTASTAQAPTPPSPTQVTPPTQPPSTAAPSTAAAATAAKPDVAPASVPVRVESVPPGAAIAVNDEATNQQTPASLSLSGPGPHRLRLTRQGFVTHEVSLTEADLQKGAVSYTLAPAAAAAVDVVIESTYPVEVFSGSQRLAAAAQTHKLRATPGSTIRVSARQYLLNAALRVTGKPIEYRAPALGRLTVLTSYETCSIVVSGQDLGFPPITQKQLAAGEYRVDVSCKDGQNPPGQYVTVLANSEVTARIR